MNIVNKVKVTICGKEYNLQTDETPDYLISLAKRVDKEIGDLVKAKPNFGIQNAAVFVALTSLDEAQKAADSIENIRTQIKTYMSETAKARKEKEKLAEKNKALSEKIEALEKEIKELKKRPPQFDCEQLVLENTITPAVMIYAEENAASSEDTNNPVKEQEPEEKKISEDLKEPEEKKADEENAAPEKGSAPEAKAEDTPKPEEAPKEQADIAPLSDEKKEAPAQTAECGSDASNGEEKADSAEHGGIDGGTGSEAPNDGGNSQNADVTQPHQNRKSRKKRH
ncbi:MAG: cell division protein ZapA [Oscillospiraceae bacterium]|nr:cell division protein ZapA [Oscillospiraceae bacterium]